MGMACSEREGAAWEKTLLRLEVWGLRLKDRRREQSQKARDIGVRRTE